MKYTVIEPAAGDKSVNVPILTGPGELHEVRIYAPGLNAREATLLAHRLYHEIAATYFAKCETSDEIRASDYPGAYIG